jgi:amino acid transporter
LIITIQGIRISLKYTLTSSLIELALILIFSIVVIVEAGPSNSFLPFTPYLSPTGWQGVFYGLFFSMLAFAGYDTTVNIAEEAKLPQKTIGRAVIVQVLLTGFVFIIMAYATTIGWGMYNMDTFATSITNGISIPGVLLVYKYLGIFAVITMLILVGNSTISSSTSFLNAVGRNLYALGREVLPGSLAKVSRRYRTPYISLSLMSISINYNNFCICHECSKRCFTDPQPISHSRYNCNSWNHNNADFDKFCIAILFKEIYKKVHSIPHCTSTYSLYFPLRSTLCKHMATILPH